jgi:hypothetical protein
MPEDSFVDYYELMQISPHAEAETVERVFRLLASRYHPDNPETGDLEKFLLLGRAREVLLNPEVRAAFDVHRTNHKEKPMTVFSMKDFTVGIDGEANRRLGVLCLLYNQRRNTPDAPGFSLLDLETLMASPREHLMFTLWYLQEKSHARRDEQSNYVISAEGVDYVESNLDSNQILYKLLKAAENGSSSRSDPSVWYVNGDGLSHPPVGKDSQPNTSE